MLTNAGHVVSAANRWILRAQSRVPELTAGRVTARPLVTLMGPGGISKKARVADTAPTRDLTPAAGRSLHHRQKSPCGGFRGRESKIRKKLIKLERT